MSTNKLTHTNIIEKTRHFQNHINQLLSSNQQITAQSHVLKWFEEKVTENRQLRNKIENITGAYHTPGNSKEKILLQTLPTLTNNQISKDQILLTFCDSSLSMEHFNANKNTYQIEPNVLQSSPINNIILNTQRDQNEIPNLYLSTEKPDQVNEINVQTFRNVDTPIKILENLGPLKTETNKKSRGTGSMVSAFQQSGLKADDNKEKKTIPFVGKQSIQAKIKRGYLH